MATKVKKSTSKPKSKASATKKISKKKIVKPTGKKHSATNKIARKMVAKAAAKKPVAKAPMRIPVKIVEAKKPIEAAKPQPVVSQPVPQQQYRGRHMGRHHHGPAMIGRPAIVPQPGRKSGFAVGEYVVYPTHGVGKILGLETETIGEFELKVFVIAFEKDKMTLRVPIGRAEAAGLRSISPTEQITRAITTLKGRAKIARGMWSRRAQEYEAKINSGNLVQIAEVVRDLHKNVDQSERSYSERMIYETAMHRLSGEVAASERVDLKVAQERLLKVLRKQAAAAA